MWSLRAVWSRKVVGIQLVVGFSVNGFGLFKFGHDNILHLWVWDGWLRPRLVALGSFGSGERLNESLDMQVIRRVPVNKRWCWW